jgi:RNA polymerase sigma-32 factor
MGNPAGADGGVSECVLLGGLDNSEDSHPTQHRQIANGIGYPMLSAPEERLLVERAQAGDVLAKHRLLLAFLPIVRRIARKYRGRADAWDDFDAEAYAGLERSLVSFDPERGFRLATYGQFWIEEGVRNYARRGSVVRGPSRGPGKIDVSLNAPVDADGEGREAIDVLADDGLDPEASLIQDEDCAIARATVGQALVVLDDRERRIFAARQLSEDYKAPTLAAVGAEIGITAERVRQLEAIAFKKVAAAVRERQKLAKARAVTQVRRWVDRPPGPLLAAAKHVKDVHPEWWEAQGRRGWPATPRHADLLAGVVPGPAPRGGRSIVFAAEPHRASRAISWAKLLESYPTARKFTCEVIGADFTPSPCLHPRADMRSAA